MRDNIHSFDVARFIAEFVAMPRSGEVYNLGGGKANSISIIEAITLVERFTGRRQRHTYVGTNRIGDHICNYSMQLFRSSEGTSPLSEMEYNSTFGRHDPSNSRSVGEARRTLNTMKVLNPTCLRLCRAALCADVFFSVATT